MEQGGRADATGARDASLKGAGEELFAAIAQRARDVADLAAAEVRLAALSGLAMVVLVMIGAAALLIAWGLVVTCALYLLWKAQLGWIGPALGFALAHAVLAYYVWQTTVRLSRNLTLPALRREVLHAPPKMEQPADVVAMVPGRP